jgi:hypothetical protein
MANANLPVVPNAPSHSIEVKLEEPMKFNNKNNNNNKFPLVVCVAPMYTVRGVKGFI